MDENRKYGVRDGLLKKTHYICMGANARPLAKYPTDTPYSPSL